MERIRGFKARRGGAGRSTDAENSGDADNNGFVISTVTKKREQYAEQRVRMSHKELEHKYIELLAKLDDTEAFWKDDCRHKDKRIAELERSLKVIVIDACVVCVTSDVPRHQAMSDTKDHLDIKLKMAEQELLDVKEEKAAMRAHYEEKLEAAAKLQRANAVRVAGRLYG